jgi:hypothetical protein
VPEGQLSMHCPWERTNPGRQPVHCASLRVDATLKFGILHEVHFAPQPNSRGISELKRILKIGKVRKLTVTFVLIVVGN